MAGEQFDYLFNDEPDKTEASALGLAEQPGAEFDYLFDEDETAIDQQVQVNMQDAVNYNPDEYAKLLDQAERDGIDPELAVRQKDTVLNRQKVNTPELVALRKEQPEVHALLGDVTFARLAHDDIENLSRVSLLLKTPEPFTSAVDKGLLVNDIGDLGYEVLNGRELNAYEEARLARMRKRQSKEYETDNFIEYAAASTAELGAQMLDTMVDIAPESLAMGVAGGAAAAPTGVGALPGFLAAGGGAFGTNLVFTTYRREAGHAYLELRDTTTVDGFTVEPEVAKAGAHLIGMANAAVEGGAFGFLTRKVLKNIGFSGMEKLSKDKVLEAIRTQPSIRTALKNLGKSFAIIEATETGAEVLQELIPMMVREVFVENASDGTYEDITLEQYIATAEEVAKKVASGMAPIALAGGSVNFAADVQRAKTANDNKALFEALAAEAEASKVRERAPARYQAMIKKLTENGPVQSVYVDAQKAREFLQSQGQDMQTLVDIVPSLDIDKVNAALVGEDFIEIPIDEFTTHIAPTELFNGLANDIKTEVDGWTSNESKFWSENYEQDYRREIDEALAEFDERMETEDSADRVMQEVFQQLQGSGKYDEQAARTQAAVTRAFFKTMATREGLDPYQYFQSLGLSIRSPDIDPLRAGNVEQLDFMLDRLRAGRVPQQGEVFGESLLEFIANRGGVVDESGELDLRDIEDWRKGSHINRRISRDDGYFTMDDAARAAQEAGYLPADQAYSPNLLLEAIDRELGGEQVFADRNIDFDLRSQKDALDAMDEFLSRNGIDLDALDNEQVKAALQALAEGQPDTLAADGLYLQDDRNDSTIREDDTEADAQLDLFAAASVPETEQAQREDTFNVRYVQDEVGQIRVGTTTATTAEDAAHIIAPIRKHAQETMLAVVTDATGEVVNVIRHTKGVKDASKVSVAELTAAVAATPGAAGVWFGHNHPSGALVASESDRTITGALTDAMEASGVEVQGHVIVATGRMQATQLAPAGYEVGRVHIRPAPRKGTLGVTERVLRKRKPNEIAIGSPDDALALTEMLQTDTGLVLLNTKHEVLGVLSLSQDEMQTLRDGESIPRILRTLDSTNAAAGIVLAKDTAAGRNIGNYLARLRGFRHLDTVVDGHSFAQEGIEMGSANKEFLQKQQPQTDTPAFKRWFGDSKAVVNVGGDTSKTAKFKPQVMYHTTRNDFSVFEAGRETTNGGTFGAYKTTRAAIFFTPSLSDSQLYGTYDDQFVEGANVMPVYISAQNPLDVTRQLDTKEEEALLNATGASYNWLSNFDWEYLDGEEGEYLVSKLKELGYDSIIFNEENPDTGEMFETWAVFEPNQIKSAIGNNGEFNPDNPNILKQEQSDIQDANASIQLPEVLGQGDVVINLFQTANLSSFLHESGHLYLEVLKDLATREGATEQTRKDWEAVSRWLGIKPGEAITTEQHENWARGFETYLFEGRAPSTELQPHFDSVRGWLIAIYQYAKTLRGWMTVDLNDDVRDVMDRMLATQEEIADARDQMQIRPAITDPQIVGMSDDEFANYNAAAQAAVDDAARDMERKALRQKQREQQKQYRELRKTLQAEVEAEMQRDPVQNAISFLRFGKLLNGDETLPPMKLSKAGVLAILDNSEPSLKRLPGVGGHSVYRIEGGIHPDQAADIFGFETGEQLVMAIINAPDRKEFVAREVDRRMREAMPNMFRDGSAAQEAMDALHNDKRGKFLETELKALSRRASTRFTPANVARETARQIVARSSYRDLSRPHRYLQAERRAGRAAERAILQENFAEAARQKRIQLVNHHLYREATRAREEVEAFQKYANKFSQPGTRKNLARDYLDQIDDVLARFDFGNATNKELDRRQSLVDWVNKLKDEEGLEVEASDLALNVDTRKHYTQLTLEEIRGLRDTVKSIEHVARLKQKLLTQRDKILFEDAVEELVTAAHDNVGSQNRPVDLDKTNVTKLGERTRQFFAEHVKMEFLFDQLDGYKAQGVWWRYLFQPIAEAEAQETEQLNKAAARVHDILGVYSEKERKTWHVKKFRHGNLSLSKNNVMAIALNWGNAGNRQALLESEKYGLDVDTVEDILAQHMTQQDWETVQALWDMIDEFWPAISALEKELTGVVPGKVDALAVDTPFGTFKGGYYPLKYDPALSALTHRRDQKENLESMFGASYTRAATRKGHTKERTGSAGQNVMLDVDTVLSGHVQNVIHDLTHRKAIIEVNRLIRDKRVEAALKDTVGTEMYNQLNPWLTKIAADRYEPGLVWERILSHARAGASVVNMGWKFTTAIVQPLGYLQTIPLLGEVYAMKGLKDFYRPGKMMDNIQFVMDRSVMMRNRNSNMDRDLRDAMRNLQRSGKRTIITDSYFKMIGLMDLTVSMPTWLGAYAKAMDGKMENIKAGDEQAAINYADSVVRMSQSAGAVKDLAQVQNHGEVLKIFTMFYSYFSVLYNMLRRTRGKQKSAKDVPNTVLSMIYLVVLPSVLAELITGRGPEDDEDPLAWAARKSAVYPLMSLVGIRDVANSVESGFGYSITPVADALNVLVNTGKHLERGMTGDDVAEALVKDAVFGAGYLFKLPARQVWMSGEYFKDWINGDLDGDFNLYEFLVTGDKLND